MLTLCNRVLPATDLNIFDSNVFVHGRQHYVQRFVYLLAGFKPQQVVEIIQYFCQQFVAILIDGCRH